MVGGKLYISWPGGLAPAPPGGITPGVGIAVGVEGVGGRGTGAPGAAGPGTLGGGTGL